MKLVLRTQRGVALLIILTLIIAAFAAAVTGAISINSIRAHSVEASAQALKRAKQALEGFALRQSIIGGLPCPDTNGDGFANENGAQCVSLRGLLPYKTLGMPEALDAQGSRIWYGLERNYAANSAAQRNPSSSASLHLDGLAMAAIVLAPNRVLGNQVRNSILSVDDFLEGENADSDLTQYARISDDDHNDLILGLKRAEFWHRVQRAQLALMAQTLLDYHAACGQFPWAADFGSAPFISVDTQSTGALPLHSALPENWNSGCASGIEPEAQWATHWGEQVLYAMCAPSASACLQLTGDSSNAVDLVLVAPGIALSGQLRPSTDLSNLFEGDNADGNSPFDYREIHNLTTSFNDVVYPVTP